MHDLNVLSDLSVRNIATVIPSSSIYVHNSVYNGFYIRMYIVIAYLKVKRHDNNHLLHTKQAK